MKYFKLPNKPIKEIIDYYYNFYKLSKEMINKKNIKRSIKESKLVEIQLPKLNYFAQNNHVNNDSESDEEYVNKDFQCISFNEEHSKNEKICIICAQ